MERYLQIECGPYDIEEGKENKADVFKELSAPVEEKLEKFLASKLHLDDLNAHPECSSDSCRNAQGSGVVAKPGKVESDLQPKVLGDLA